MIPHSQPYFDAEDESALCGALRRLFVTHGPEARRLGAMGAAVLGRSWGVAVQSGTDALTCALRLLGVAEGSRVALPAYICSAPLDSLALLRAEAVVVDVDRTTLSVDPALVNGRDDVDAVVAAHLFGVPAPVFEIRCPRLVEDCAQTLGVTVGGRPVGGYGRLSICSFYGTKLLATGHGGLLAGDDPTLKESALELLVHDGQAVWREHYHYLMSDLAASLGLSQLAKLERFVSERRQRAARYAEALGASAIAPNCAYSRFLAVAEDAEEMIDRFQAAGIEAKRPVFTPISMLLGYAKEEYPAAEWAHRHIVSVPMYPGMSEDRTAHITSFLKDHAHALCCWPPA